jgi:hypothetical protein
VPAGKGLALMGLAWSPTRLQLAFCGDVSDSKRKDDPRSGLFCLCSPS